MKRYFSDLFVGGKSLVDGLGVTLKALCQPMVTVQYPREEIDITPNFRGHIDLVLDPEKNTFRCIACGMCERSCPSECIQIKGKKVEGKRKNIGLFYAGFHKMQPLRNLCGNLSDPGLRVFQRI